MEKNIGLTLAIEKAGNKKRLAELLGISRQSVQKWQAVPELYQYRLARLKPEWFA